MNRIILKGRKLFVAVLIVPIKIYQYAISPYTPASCRHIPTCSQYAIEALKVHGVFKGLYLAFRRVLRCHPWGTHGFDPVPPTKDTKQAK